MPLSDDQPGCRGNLSRRATIVTLLLITLLGGLLRFTRLSSPPMWGDEAATYSRVCGTYQDLIDVLQFNGFAPLHYELYLWIRAGLPTWARAEQRAVHPVIPQRRGSFFQNFATARPATPTTQPTTKPYLVGEHPLAAGGIRLTPAVMRIVPATAGTLMIPAMFFLAIQLVNRRAAIATALFTASSAYLLVYSRDAKMYMHFWLCCTLSMACFLWWLRARTRISWLAWIAASVATCGLQAQGGILLAVQLLIFISSSPQWWLPGLIFLTGLITAGVTRGESHIRSTTFDTRWIPIGFALLIGLLSYVSQRRRDWTPALFYLIGLSIILSGIGGYYLKFNRYKERIDEERNWMMGTGLGWVDSYNRGRDGLDLLRYSASAYLMSWEWAKPEEEPFIDLRALKLLHGAGTTVAALLVMGLFPWRWRQGRPGVGPATDPPPPQGRRLFWIGCWLVLPAYVLYCVSMGEASSLVGGKWVPGFVSPGFWVMQLRDWITHARSLAIIAASVAVVALYLSAGTIRGRVIRLLALCSGCALIGALCIAAYLLLDDLNYRSVLSGSRWHSLWMPRYLGMLWPAFAIVVATLLSRLPTRPLRWGAIGLLMAVNLAQFVERLNGSEPPTDRLAADMLASGSTRTCLLGNFVQWPGVAPGEGLYMSYAWRYYMAELSGMNIAPQEFRSEPLSRQRFIREFDPQTNRTPAMIAASVQRSPAVRRVIVWDRIDRNAIDTNADDPVKTSLHPGWRRISEQSFTVFDHWTWQKLCTVRRREYLR